MISMLQGVNAIHKTINSVHIVNKNTRSKFSEEDKIHALADFKKNGDALNIRTASGKLVGVSTLVEWVKKHTSYDTLGGFSAAYVKRNAECSEMVKLGRRKIGELAERRRKVAALLKGEALSIRALAIKLDVSYPTMNGDIKAMLTDKRITTTSHGKPFKYVAV